jgi:hypothetical protein
MITKSFDLTDLRYRLFSNDDNLREQSKRYCIEKKFSISRSNQAYRYSNSFYQKKNRRRIDQSDLHIYETNDN